MTACKAAGNLHFSGLSEVDLIACFRSALQSDAKVSKHCPGSSHKDSLDLNKFALMLLLLSARRLNRSNQQFDPTSCSPEWVAAVADLLMSIGFVSHSDDPEPSSANSTSNVISSHHDSNFKSPHASYLRRSISRDLVDAPIQPHHLMSRNFNRLGTSLRANSFPKRESSKPMRFVWQPQLFSSYADLLSSPGAYELPVYMRRDWEIHRLRKNSSGKMSMMFGLPPSRGRTARTFSDIPYIGHPQEVFGQLSFLIFLRLRFRFFRSMKTR